MAGESCGEGAEMSQHAQLCNTGPPSFTAFPPVPHLILTKQHLRSQALAGRIACFLPWFPSLQQTLI